MEHQSKSVIGDVLDFRVLGIQFTKKPVVVGGLAMEYYGLRKHGDDIDLIVSNEDYQTLAQKYPAHKKDIWGDLGINYNGYEAFRSIWRLDYAFYSENAAEYDRYLVISVEKLFLMKVLARNAGEKYAKDLELMLAHFLKAENPEYKKYMDGRIEKYLAVPGGIILGDQ